MMDALISRDVLYKDLQATIGSPTDEKLYEVNLIIMRQPAVDAVPVVRCSECKYAHMTYDGECKYCDFWQEDGGDALYLDKGFYCAAGERRDGEAQCP